MKSVELEDYRFRVAEAKVLFQTNGVPYQTNDYKGIVDSRNGELISVVKKDYNILPNDVLIDQLMYSLEDSGFKHYIDPSHSFVLPNRMRLQVTFPELQWNDPESKNNLSLFMHNSYDYSEGIRIYWGAIRGICTNGMIFGHVIKSFYSKHTSGFDITELRLEMEEAYKKIPLVKQRYDILQRINATEVIKKVEDIELEFGKKIVKDKEITQESLESMKAYTLLNLLTNYVSHNIAAQNRLTYQKSIAKAFQL